MSDKFSKENIEQELYKVLNKTFEIPLEDLNINVNLYTDLDLDSIDAVDLVIELQNFTDKKIDPEVFKEIRTASDVVEAVYELMHKA